jgi:hypothetical protein
VHRDCDHCEGRRGLQDKTFTAKSHEIFIEDTAQAARNSFSVHCIGSFVIYYAGSDQLARSLPGSLTNVYITYLFMHTRVPRFRPRLSFRCTAAVWTNCTNNAMSHHVERGKEDNATEDHRYEDSFIVLDIRARFYDGALCDRYMARFRLQRAHTQCSITFEYARIH